jgi:serine/threonine-protein kinase RsbW
MDGVPEMLVRLELALPRDARYVGMMREVAGCVLDGIGAPEDATADVQLALSEACANAVRHAVGTAEYSVRFGVSAHAVEIEIIDVGPGFPVDPDGPAADPDSESGRGLTLINALVDDCEFVRDGRDNRVRLTKRFEDIRPPAPAPEDLPADLRG